MIKKKVNIIPYIRIIRYHNALMAGLTTFLGYWLSDSSLPLSSVFLLILATICSTGFGNTINDIYDIDSDRINHPNRPLPQGAISVLSAWIFSLLLLISALVLSFSVSSLHGFATVLPLLLLTIYAFFLKATPIAGNLLVATLVAYTILYGALGSVGFPRLIFPASMAFFLNFHGNHKRSSGCKRRSSQRSNYFSVFFCPNTKGYHFYLQHCLPIITFHHHRHESFRKSIYSDRSQCYLASSCLSDDSYLQKRN